MHMYAHLVLYDHYSTGDRRWIYMINMWHNAAGDYVTILAVYKTMYENASKIALSATNRK